jgi:hypothetical protein
MKTLFLTGLVALSMAHFASAERAPDFGGLEKAMDADTYEKAGLRKLTSDERAALDAFIRDYVAGKQKDTARVAAAQAVDQAVKEKKVRPPELIESKIVGVFKGYGPRTLIPLENGQIWQPTNGETNPNAPIQSPNVTITHDFFGYQMAIEGALTVRVKRVQ